jgi:hypothetical protein
MQTFKNIIQIMCLSNVNILNITYVIIYTFIIIEVLQNIIFLDKRFIICIYYLYIYLLIFPERDYNC